MKIYNARVFTDGKFIDGGVEFEDRILSVGDIGADGTDAKGAYLIPGLVDIHTHAAVGEDASDGSAEGMVKMSRYYAHDGVTSWCPTTMTLKEPELTRAVECIASFVRPQDGAKVAGINMEGPFLSYAKRGAQNPDNLHAPDAELFRRLNAASGGLVRLVTVAPEEPGAIDFIREVSKLCTVSVGHTTAGYDCAMKAFEAGASHTTHLFNAMPSLHHREPAVIAAASDSGATVELITDGIHVHPAAIRLTSRLFGRKLVLISDSLSCAGMPDGDYTLGGLDVSVRNGKATLTGTDTLAGSSIHLMEGLRRSVQFGISLEDAVTAASTAPAEVIGRSDIGRIAVGCWADMVLLDKELNVLKVFVDGKEVR